MSGPGSSTCGRSTTPAISPTSTTAAISGAPWISLGGEGVLLRVLVVPRASRTEVVGPQGDYLKVRVAAPPVDDAANEELIAFLARALGVVRARVTIRSGERGRRKVVEVIGVSPEETEAALTRRSGRR